MALTDDIERIAAIFAGMHQGQMGPAWSLRTSGRLELSTVGKLCGVSGSTVKMWETGELQPTTSQALAWLSALYARQSALTAQRAADRVATTRAAAEGGLNLTEAAARG